MARERGRTGEALAASAALTAGRRLHVLLVCFLAVVAASITSFLVQAPVTAASMIGIGGTSILAPIGAASAGLAVLLAAPFPLIVVTALYDDLRSARREGTGLGAASPGVYTPGR